MRARLILAVGLGLLTVAAGRAPSSAQPQIRERLHRVVHPGEARSFLGSYTVETVSEERRPDGSLEHTIEIAVRVTRSRGGIEHRDVLRVRRDGEDLTAEGRRELLPLRSGVDRQDRGKLALREPFGGGEIFYRVGPLRRAGKVLLAAFAPRPEYGSAANLGRGSIAFDPATLTPVWVDMEAVRSPNPLRSLHVHYDLVQDGGTVFVAGVEQHGEAGRWLFERSFDVTTKVEDISPARH